ncbi:ribonuclease HI family protein [Candidatus Peregrinibacteria bacterium]|nr:ribonuclease HI family protein [Candidatus Peregrinibacteria bacterium]
MISKSLQAQLDKHIPKREQQAFVELAVKTQLHKHMAMNAESIEVYVDGGSRGNPGPAGGGFAVFRGGENVLQGSEFYGEKTNNQAEYLALRTALREVYSRFPDLKIHCFMDSQLVVEQMSGNYKVKNANIRPLFDEVQRIVGQFKVFTIRHIERAQNSLADQLANEAMDRKK